MQFQKVLYKSVLIFLSLFFLSCAVNPVTQKKEFSLVTESQEIQIGKTSHKEIIEEFGDYNDASLQSYVNEVGQKLSRVSHRSHLKFHFTVLDSPVVNALATPGGYIYLTRGILAEFNSEAEMATILAHEIGHVTARHAARQITRVTTYQILSTLIASIDKSLEPLQRISNATASLIFLKYSRDDEREADQLGLEYASNARYNPKPMVAFLENLLRKEKKEEVSSLPSFLSTHPTTRERIQTVRTEAARLLKESKTLKLTAYNEYKSHLDGMVYGPGEKDGIIYGEVYKNKFAGLALTFPHGWKKQSSRLLFVTKHPNRNYLFQLQIHELKRDIGLDDFVYIIEKKIGLPRGPIQRVTLNNLHGVKRIYEGKNSSGRMRLSIIYFLEPDKKIGYTLLSFAPLREYNNAYYYFSNIERSFRKLSSSEIDAIKIKHIKIHTVKKGESFADLSKRYYGNDKKKSKIAGFNSLSIDIKLLQGEKIKIILP